jgi:hypothetical protein
MRYTADGRWVRPAWIAWLFGGTFISTGGGGGYAWRPSLFRMVRRYYREGWSAAGYSLRDWLRL